jgi:hypothetical protein
MKEAKHTPGPWRWVENSVSEKGCRCIQFRGSSYWDIGSIQSHPLHGYSDDEAFANARLIAAAPELLHALQQADEYLHEMNYGIRGYIRTLVRNAIAKATGKEGAE